MRVKNKVLSIFLMLLSLSVFIFSNNVYASGPDVDVTHATELFWTNSDQVTDGSEYHLVSDAFDGNFLTLPNIASVTISQNLDDVVLYNGVGAIYPEHLESYTYFVYKVSLEEVHFYTFKLQLRQIVPYDELVSITSTSDAPYKSYNDGFVEGFDYGKNIGYNNGYQEGKSDGFDDGFIDGFNDGESLGYNNGYFDSYNNYFSDYNIDAYNNSSFTNKVNSITPGLYRHYINYHFMNGSSYSLTKYNDYKIKNNNIDSMSNSVSIPGNPSKLYFYFDGLINVYDYSSKNKVKSLDLSGLISISISSAGGSSPYRLFAIYENDVEVYRKTDSSNSLNVYFEISYSNVSNISYMLDNNEYYQTKVRRYSKLVPPKDPYKVGSVFKGWFEEGYTEESFNFEIGANKDVVLYAVFVEYSKIILEGLDIELSGEVGKEIEVPNDPIKNGYKFLGWYTDEEFEEEYIFDVYPEEDIIIYAKWELEEITIEFYLGEALYSTKVISIEDELILPSTPISEEENEQFLGWYYEDYFATKFKTTDPLTEDVSLYGKFGLDSGGGGQDEPPGESTSKPITKYLIIAGWVAVGVIALTLIYKSFNSKNKKSKRR